MRERPATNTAIPTDSPSPTSSTALHDADAGTDPAPDAAPEDLVMSHLRAADAQSEHVDAASLLAAGVVEDWRELGECRGADLSLFYPDDDDDLGAELAAKAICAACAVREQCLERALEVREREGVWGGLSPRERRRILRRRRRDAA